IYLHLVELVSPVLLRRGCGHGVIFAGRKKRHRYAWNCLALTVDNSSVDPHRGLRVFLWFGSSCCDRMNQGDPDSQHQQQLRSRHHLASFLGCGVTRSSLFRSSGNEALACKVSRSTANTESPSSLGGIAKRTAPSFEGLIWSGSYMVSA